MAQVGFLAVDMEHDRLSEYRIELNLPGFFQDQFEHLVHDASALKFWIHHGDTDLRNGRVGYQYKCEMAYDPLSFLGNDGVEFFAV